MEEYLYLTKGLRIQLESGLDPIKNGYTIKTEYQTWVSDRHHEFIHMTKEGETNPVAIGIIIRNGNQDFKNFLCIPRPTSSKNVLEKYSKAIKGLGLGNTGFHFPEAMGNYAMYLASKKG